MVLASSTPTVIWHDLECGTYRADLPLWRELAREARHSGQAKVLDLGAGSGRVSLALARAGHEVTALDRDDELLQALAERARDLGGATVHTVCADARDFQLAFGEFDLCVVPMQTIQLLAGGTDRQALMGCARGHLRPGALFACAIVTDIDGFDYVDGGWGPEPERGRVDGAEYVSRAVRVRVGRRSFTIERERTVTAAGSDVVPPERDVVKLARVTAASLRREGRRAGFADAGSRIIPPTDEHVGSEVVLLRA